MATWVHFQTFRLLKKGLTLIGSKQNAIRSIATSKKNSENAVHRQNTTNSPEPWESYGFDFDDKFKDRFGMHITYFMMVSLAFILGGTMFAYVPDPKRNDWAQREAYLQLRHREEHGLPRIDGNLLDPATINLPTDEELGDTNIII